jgi:hypothetical protein
MFRKHFNFEFSKALAPHKRLNSFALFKSSNSISVFCIVDSLLVYSTTNTLFHMLLLIMKVLLIIRALNGKSLSFLLLVSHSAGSWHTITFAQSHKPLFNRYEMLASCAEIEQHIFHKFNSALLLINKDLISSNKVELPSISLWLLVVCVVCVNE